MHTISEFKGHKVISLRKQEGDKYGIQFGLSKAKLILSEIEAIADFVASSEVPNGKPASKESAIPKNEILPMDTPEDSVPF